VRTPGKASKKPVTLQDQHRESISRIRYHGIVQLMLINFRTAFLPSCLVRHAPQLILRVPLLLALAGSPLHAQTSAPGPKLDNAPVNLIGDPTTKKASPETAQAKAQGEQVKEQSFTISAYRLEGGTILSKETVHSVVRKHTGANKTLEDINKAVSALKTAYADAGYPVVAILPPPQTSEDGLIVLRVVEGKIRAVTVDGNRFHEEANILDSLPRLYEGELIDIKQSIADLSLANENASKKVALDLQPGDNPGDVIARLDVNDQHPQQWNLNLDNSGSQNSGTTRVSFGYQHDNLFNADHTLTSQFATSLEYPKRSQSYSLGYRVPLYEAGLSLEGFAAYSDSDSGNTSTPNGVLTFTGKGTNVGLRLNQPLRSSGAYRHRLTYGYDFKDFNNTCSSNNVQLTKKECGTVTSQPLSLTYSGQYQSPAMQLSGWLSYYANIVGPPHGRNSDYRYSTNNDPTYRRAHWGLWRGGLSLNVPMGDWSILTSVNAQSTQNHLISGEQFGAGGASSIRGYSERSITGDAGYYANVELVSANFANWLKMEDTGLRFVMFYDSGYVENNYARLTSSVKRQDLGSAGVGLRFNWGSHLSIRMDNGVALKKFESTTAGAGREKGDSFLHFSLSLSY